MGYWDEPHRKMAISCKFFESGGTCVNQERIRKLNLYDSNKECPLFKKIINYCEHYEKRKDENV